MDRGPSELCSVLIKEFYFKFYHFQIEDRREIGYKRFSMETWRLLDTGARSAVENMALDEALLEWKAAETIPNTLRFLQFSNPTVLVGHHQSVEEEVRLDYCRTHGIEINRRLTGGGALYWGRNELGWEIYISKKDPRIPARMCPSVTSSKLWRRGSESNRRIKVLQTSPLPLGYRALN